MRAIQFRAWDTEEKKYCWPWPEGFDIFGEVTCFNLITQELMKNPHGKHSLIRLNDVIIEQFTGLLDKNGKEIYEGDICRWENIINSGSYAIMEIQWHDYQQGFLPFINGTTEVIGNIHENPELLK